MVKKVKYNIGDSVLILKSNSPACKQTVGKCGIITAIDPAKVEDKYAYLVTFKSLKQTWWYLDDEFEIIEDGLDFDSLSKEEKTNFIKGIIGQLSTCPGAYSQYYRVYKLLSHQIKVEDGAAA
jgi:hypothetical protein